MEYIGTDREKSRQRKIENRKAARRHVDHYLSRHPCKACGVDDARVLQFHHRDPKRKEMMISTMVSRGLSLVSIDLEIEKCDVLCANCHAIHHHDERRSR